jgi:hypothetical protein
MRAFRDSSVGLNVINAIQVNIKLCYTIGTSGKAALLKQTTRRLENENQNFSITHSCFFSEAIVIVMEVVLVALPTTVRHTK